MGGNRTSAERRRELDALRKFLTPVHPVSARFCGYSLLSAGLLSSTEDFHDLNRRLTRMRVDEELDDNCFIDNRRRVDVVSTWPDLESFREYAATIYTRSFWQDQPRHVEIWLEKDTNSFLVEPVADEYQVPVRVSSGHYSRPFLYRAARDLADVRRNRTDVPMHILYVGDFDPSGLDIERAAQRGDPKYRKQGVADILEAQFGWDAGQFDKQVSWTRVAVTEDDFFRLPESAKVPLKPGDTRKAEYVKKYGHQGAEVEALEVIEPGLLARRVGEAIQSLIDHKTWRRSERKQREDLKRLRNGAGAA